MLTIEEVKEAMPIALSNRVNQTVVDTLNKLSADPLEAKVLAENFISYSSVLKTGKFRIEDYVNAVTFVTHLLTKKTSAAAYEATFPKRYATLIKKGCSSQKISSYVSMYKGTTLVTKILQQAVVPIHLYHQNTIHEAVNVLQKIIHDDTISPKVRTDAATSILTHLKMPVEATPKLEIELKESSAITDLKDTLRELTQTQQKLIATEGITTKKVIDAEYKTIIKKE